MSVEYKLRKYLKSEGLDAYLILEVGLDATGFYELAREPSGQFKQSHIGASPLLDRARREWPSPLVFENVNRILAGGDALPAPKKAEDPKPAPKKAEK